MRTNTQPLSGSGRCICRMCNTSGEPLCSTTMAFIIFINVPFNHHMTECHPGSIRLISLLVVSEKLEPLFPRASPVLHWRARLRERKAQVQGGRWFKFTSVGTLVEFGEGGPCLARRNHLLRIDGRADGVGGELRRGAHPLAGLVPVPEVVNLQLHAIAVGIHVVERGGHAVIQTGVRLDALTL